MTRSAAWFALALALLVLASLAYAMSVLPFPTPDALGVALASAVVASTKSVLALRPFALNDWHCYGGATSAPDGRAPMIADLNGDEAPDGIGLTVIADALGVEVFFYVPVEMSAEGLTYEDVVAYRVTLGDEASNATYALAVFLASSLPATMTSAYLKGIGFARVG